MGFFEACLKTVSKTIESLGTFGLGKLTFLGSLLLDGGSACLFAGIFGLNISGSSGFEVRVKFLHHSLVLKRILLGLKVVYDGCSDFSKFGLDLIGVDNAGKISTVNDVTLELISVFVSSFFGVGSENFIEGFKSITGEDNESTDLTTGGELEEVKSVDIADINTG